jgi:hypothetical protein
MSEAMGAMLSTMGQVMGNVNTQIVSQLPGMVGGIQRTAEDLQKQLDANLHPSGPGRVVINVVFIAADGALTVAGEPCPANELASRLATLKAKQPTAIAIQADRDAPFKQVEVVVDACNNAGIELFTQLAVPSVPEATADLKARLVAAESITAFTEQDESLAAIARDSARAGDAALTKQALGRMTAFTARDTATLEAARELVKVGCRAAAIEIAKTITALTQRDAALKELAQ